ncbi:hypothetical protein ABFX02_05G120900 [Erythranthe guttata]
MATIRRNAAPEKEKKIGELLSASHTGTKRTSHDSITATPKRIPIYPKPAVNSNNNVSKPMVKKPAPTQSTTTTTAPKSSLAARRSTLDKTPMTQTPKTRIISTNNLSIRSSSSSVSAKTSVPQKPIPGKNSNVVTKDVVKPIVKRSIITVKKQDITKKRTTTTNNDEKVVTKDVVKRTVGKSSTATKKQEITKQSPTTTTTTTTQKITRSNISKGPEPEIQPEHQESCVDADEEQKVLQSASNDEKGNTVNSVADDQEPLNFEGTEDGGDDQDTKAVTDEDFTFLENQDDPLIIETQEPEEHKSYVEEIKNMQNESEEHSTSTTNTMNEINSSSNGESFADNKPNEEAEEKEVVEVKEVEKHEEEEEEEKIAEEKKEELASEEFKEQKEQIAVEEKKQEPGHTVTKQHQFSGQGKKDSPVSNNVIEETASKLRQQRQNKVKALAGAFETVISLQ